MSCNPYADAGYKDPELWQQKARIVNDMRRSMQVRELTPSRAARIVGMPLPEFRAMIKGHFGDIDVTKLVDCLRRLGHDIEIQIKPLPDVTKKPGTITVIPPHPLPRTA
jgi:predicted XRE-type DNA-binding protein